MPDLTAATDSPVGAPAILGAAPIVGLQPRFVAAAVGRRAGQVSRRRLPRRPNRRSDRVEDH